MKREKTRFCCTECGHESLKWLGKCPGCGQWNTFVEEVQMKGASAAPARQGLSSREGPRPIASVSLESTERMGTGIEEFDRVLGGGMVPGSLVLVGGDPGIGKSTLLLQAAFHIGQEKPVLYVSGEESLEQIGLRAGRLGAVSENLYLLTETNIFDIEKYINKLKPSLVIVDSIQTMFRDDLSSAPGSVGQVRESAGYLLRLAKESNTPICLVGHVTKEGAIAGPRVLEHMVDTVLYFEGERQYHYRLLRAVKNRFGSTNETGIFEMTSRGLAEVANPSEMFLAERPEGASGSVVIPSLEGTRPLLVELQALVSPTTFGTPRRMTTGVDYNRIALIIAVLEKRVGLHLGNQDAFVKVAGGFKLDEPAVDLGVAAAIASSFRDLPVDPRVLVFGEVGLAGEVRAVAQPEKRLKEAAKLGFKRCVLPKNNCQKGLVSEELELIGVATVEEALEAALGGE